MTEQEQSLVINAYTDAMLFAIETPAAGSVSDLCGVSTSRQ
ncbi:MAG: hypothetical protein OSB73_19670 [Candidatus Latescibacteria bacterium]|nr:hypothetical protein [Candidatus Latescibacterota bacterium]